MPAFEAAHLDAPAGHEQVENDFDADISKDGDSPSSHLSKEDLTVLGDIEPVSVAGEADSLVDDVDSQADSDLASSTATLLNSPPAPTQPLSSSSASLRSSNASSAVASDLTRDPLHEWLAKSLAVDLSSLRLGEGASSSGAKEAGDEEKSQNDTTEAAAVSTRRQGRGASARPRARCLQMKRIAPFLEESGLDVEKGFILVNRGSEDAAVEATETQTTALDEAGAATGMPGASRLSVFLPAMGAAASCMISREAHGDDESARNGQEPEQTSFAPASTPTSDPKNRPAQRHARTRSTSMLASDSTAARAAAVGVSGPSVDCDGARATRIRARRAGMKKAAEAEDADADAGATGARGKELKGRAFVELEFQFVSARMAHVL